MPDDPIELDVRRTGKYIVRALRLRCPECGQGRMFKQWLVQLSLCNQCGLRFDRGEADYFIGAYIVNLIVAELVVVAAMLIGMLVTWPDVPWNTLKWILLPLVIVMPLVTYPFSKSIWLAIDLVYRPATVGDFTE